jgi:tetratricopeptide (TPR) repeat protein
MSGKKFFILILLNCFLFGYSQTANTIDSLRLAVSVAKSDTARTVALCEFSKALVYSKPDSAFYYAKEAYELASELNFKWGKAHAFFAMGVVRKVETKYGEALNYYNQALVLFKEFNDPNTIASTYNNIGLIHFSNGDYSNALINFNTALKLFRKAGNVIGESTALGNLGLSYYNGGDYEKSLEYDSLAILIDKKTNNRAGIARHTGNMGNAYMFRAAEYKSKGMVNETQAMYDKAIKALSFAAEECEKLNDMQGAGLHIGNLANLYFDMGNIEKTMEYNLKALDICEKANDKQGMSRQYGNIGWVLFEAKDYKRAIEYTKKAIAMLEGMSDLTLKYNWYDNLTGMYEAVGDYKSAFESYQQFILFRDSLFSIDKARKTMEAQKNIEFERKEEMARQEQAKQAIIRNAFITGFVLMFIMAVIVFRGYRNKQKANKLISEQKELVELKNKEITDSIRYAKRIQKAHLPHDDYIAKKLNELNKRS